MIKKMSFPFQRGMAEVKIENEIQKSTFVEYIY